MITAEKDVIERLAFGVAEAAEALSVSPQFIRAEVSSGKLGCVRLGRRVLITRQELERYLASAPTEREP